MRGALLCWRPQPAFPRIEALHLVCLRLRLEIRLIDLECRLEHRIGLCLSNHVASAHTLLLLTLQKLFLPRMSALSLHFATQGGLED